jgi:hypothetical protein
MAISPMGLGAKNLYAGKSQQQFSSQEISQAYS